MTEITQPRRRIWRKNLVIPAEHGAWSWLLVPFAVGAVVAAGMDSASPRWGLALALTLIGGLCAYLIRQPATAWLRIRQGRGKRVDQSLALGWAIALALSAATCLASLFLLERGALTILVWPFAAVLLLYLAAASRGRAAVRALWMELAGAMGLALMAPAAVIAVSGAAGPLVWPLWALMAVQNALGVLYVRLRLADTRGRPAQRPLTLGSHLLGLACVVVAASWGWIPWLATLPTIAFSLRAAWAVQKPRPIDSVRRFGFMEVAVELVGGAVVAASYLL